MSTPVDGVARPRHQHRVRQAAVWLHRWTGLLISGFLVVTALTGTILAFADELEALLEPALFTADGAPGDAGNAGRRDPLDLRDQVAARHPDARIDWVDLETPPGRTVRFGLAAGSGGPLRGDDEVFVDPRTGHEVGSRRRGDLSQGWKNAMPFIDELHQSLALGTLGATVLGVAALLWTFDCAVGFFLTFPLRHRAPGTARSWLRRWKPAWGIRWQAAPAKLVFDLHRAAGLWVWLLLLVFAWSSVGFNLPGVYRPVMRAVFGNAVNGDMAVPRATTQHAPTVDWHRAHRLAAAAMADAARQHGFRVDHERLLHVDRDRGEYEYRVASSRDAGVRNGNTTLYLDAGSGAVRRLVLPTGVSAGSTVGTWIMAVHTASVGGVAGQAAVGAMGLVVVTLSVTGVLVWLRKRAGRRSARAARQARR